MSNLDDLNYKSILNMNNDEAIEHIRLARLRRRIEKKRESKPKTTSAKKPIFDLSTLSDADKQELLSLLGEE